MPKKMTHKQSKDDFILKDFKTAQKKFYNVKFNFIIKIKCKKRILFSNIFTCLFLNVSFRKTAGCQKKVRTRRIKEKKSLLRFHSNKKKQRQRLVPMNYLRQI